MVRLQKRYDPGYDYLHCNPCLRFSLIVCEVYIVSNVVNILRLISKSFMQMRIASSAYNEAILRIAYCHTDCTCAYTYTIYTINANRCSENIHSTKEPDIRSMCCAVYDCNSINVKIIFRSFSHSGTNENKSIN